MGVLTIILSILKVIGMILLILLGLVVFILLYLLFLPFHYELSGSHSIEDGWEGQVYFAGFLHFWQLRFAKFAEEYEVRIYACWGKLQIYPWKKKAKAVSDDEADAEDFAEDMPAEDTLDEDDIAEILEDKTVSKADVKRMAESSKTASATKATSAQADNESAEDAGNQAGAQEKQTKKTAAKKKNKSKTKKPSGGLKEKWQTFHKNVTDEHNKNAVFFLLQKALWILGRVKPTIMEADVDFSLGDPALTGGATGVISLCPVCYGKKCRIIPDFESTELYLLGSISLKGIVFLWHFVYLIVSVYFNKDCKKLFHL